jgi:hypothetical protein
MARRLYVNPYYFVMVSFLDSSQWFLPLFSLSVHIGVMRGGSGEVERTKVGGEDLVAGKLGNVQASGLLDTHSFQSKPTSYVNLNVSI